MSELKRRDLLAAGLAVVAGNQSTSSVAGTPQATSPLPSTVPAGAHPTARPEPFLLGLNTSTIRGQKLSIVEAIAVAQKAGYGGMEPWIDELERYVESGGSPEDLAQRFRDAG